MTTSTQSLFVRPPFVLAATVKAVSSLLGRLAAWREQRRRDEEDRQLWAIAQQDPRIMSDLVCALRRAG